MSHQDKAQRNTQETPRCPLLKSWMRQLVRGTFRLHVRDCCTRDLDKQLKMDEWMDIVPFWCTIEFQSPFPVLSWQEWHLVWSAPVAHLLLWLTELLLPSYQLKAFCAFSDINRAFSSRELPLTGCFLSFWILLCKQTSSLWNIKTSLSDINNHAVFKVT